jgi:hypothetical protein
MFAFALLRVEFADGLGGSRQGAGIDSRRIGVKGHQPQRREQLLSLAKNVIRPTPERLGQDDSGERVNGMPHPALRRVALHETPPLLALCGLNPANLPRHGVRTTPLDHDFVHWRESSRFFLIPASPCADRPAAPAHIPYSTAVERPLPSLPLHLRHASRIRRGTQKRPATPRALRTPTPLLAIPSPALLHDFFTLTRRTLHGFPCPQLSSCPSTMPALFPQLNKSETLPFRCASATAPGYRPRRDAAELFAQNVKFRSVLATGFLFAFSAP